MKHDLTNEYKWFRLKKHKSVSIAIDYMEKELCQGHELSLPEAVIGAHSGDWHEALRAYKRWVKSWYNPIAPRKKWFLRVLQER